MLSLRPRSHRDSRKIQSLLHETSFQNPPLWPLQIEPRPHPQMGPLVCKELYELSYGRKSFSNESFNNHVNLNKATVFSLHYVLRDLEMGGDGLEAKDDVRSLELVVAMEKYFGF